MKNILITSIVLLLSLCLMSCDVSGSDNNNDEDNSTLQFDLVFDQNADLDLHVTDPSGETIYYDNPTSASGGQLNDDCACDYCPNGNNEKIQWEPGKAPSGTYTYWVDYYSNCSEEEENDVSSYTLRVLKNGQVVVTKTGSISEGQTQKWTISL